MTDYPSIKPEDVREGDVVRGIYTYNYGQRIAVEGEVISKGSRLRIGAFLIRADLTDLRLVSRPTPPEPPLRVGDWVRHEHDGTWQIVGERGLTNCHGLTRIEPPVGWPVGVPTGEVLAVWYFKSTSSGKCVWCGDVEIDFSWSELVAAGGVPALAVTR